MGSLDSSSNPITDDWILKYNEPFFNSAMNPNSMILADENSSSDVVGSGSFRVGSPTPINYPLPSLSGPFTSGFSGSSFAAQAGISVSSFDQYECLSPQLEPSLLDYEHIMDLGSL